MNISQHIIYTGKCIIRPSRICILLFISFLNLYTIIAQTSEIKSFSGDYGNGEALVIYKNGDRYDGFFRDSLFHGKGMLKKKNKEFYEGDFKEGKYDGYGYLQLPDKNIYEGEFKEGLYHGKGDLYEYKGRTYSGDFLMGKMEGEGTITLTNGDKYIGTFRDNEIDGYGEYYSEGYLTTGLFRKGKLLTGRILNLQTQETVFISEGKPEEAGKNPPDKNSHKTGKPVPVPKNTKK